MGKQTVERKHFYKIIPVHKWKRKKRIGISPLHNPNIYMVIINTFISGNLTMNKCLEKHNLPKLLVFQKAN